MPSDFSESDSCSGRDESASKPVTLSDVLVAFQKTLARAQSHSATVRQTPDFYLGQRPLLDIDALEVDLKVGINMAASGDDFLAVHFNPDKDSATSVRFRVKMQPQEVVETGLLIFHPAEQERANCDSDVCIVSIAGGKPSPSKLNLNILPRLVPAKAAKKEVSEVTQLAKLKSTAAVSAMASEESAAAAVIQEAKESGTVTRDATTGLITCWSCLTDNKGICRVTARFENQALILSVNGHDLEPVSVSKSQYHDALIYASVGSSTSDRIDLFHPSRKP